MASFCAGVETTVDQLERPVEAGSESLGQQVVGRPGGRPDGIAALVGRAQPQGEERQGDHDDDDQGDSSGHGGTTLYPVRPAGPEPPTVGAHDPRTVFRKVLLLVPAHHLGSDESQERGEQGQRRDHGQEDADGGSYRQSIEEADTQGEHPEQGDTDDDAGAEHRPPGGVHGVDDGALGVPTRDESLAVPGDDEQRIVDANPEPDEEDQLG